MRYDECSKQDVRFVLASISDAETFGQLRKQCWQSTYRGIYPDEIIDNFDFSFHLEQDIKRLKDKQYKNFLIKRNNVNIGYMTLKFNSDFLLIQSLYLLANEQCKGIGIGLSKWCEAYVQKIECPTLSVTVIQTMCKL